MSFKLKIKKWIPNAVPPGYVKDTYTKIKTCLWLIPASNVFVHL